MDSMSYLPSLKAMTWFSVVPKQPRKRKGKAIASDGQMDIVWDTSFYQYEKKMMENPKVKAAIGLMKKLRNTNDWKCIKSYYIETLFYHELRNLKVDLDQVPLYPFFIYMTLLLQSATDKNCLPHFWNKDCNLLKQCREYEFEDTADNMEDVMRGFRGHDPYDSVLKKILSYSEYQNLGEHLRDKSKEPSCVVL